MRAKVEECGQRKLRRRERCSKWVRDMVRVVDFEPGTLMVFRGMYAPHRVSPVLGKYSRLNAVLTYSTDRRRKGDARFNKLLYGARARGES